MPRWLFSEVLWILLCSFPRFEINLFQVLPRAARSEDLTSYTTLQWCLSICLFYFSEGSGWWLVGSGRLFSWNFRMNENSAVLLQEEPPWNIHWNFSTSDYSQLYQPWASLCFSRSRQSDPPVVLESQDKMRQDQINLYGVPFR